MQVTLTGNRYVDAIAEIHIEGNITPMSWFQHIKYTNNRGTYTDHLAAYILSDIVYWYRPSEIRDEETGATKGWKKKFQGELFNRSYETYANTFGATMAQVKSACKLLERLNLIKIKPMTIQMKSGRKAGNVVHFIPCPERIKEITYTVDPQTLKRKIKKNYQSAAYKESRQKAYQEKVSATPMHEIEKADPIHEIDEPPIADFMHTNTEISGYGFREHPTSKLTGCSRPEPGRERESAPFDEPFSWEEETAANGTMEEGQPTATYSKPVSVQPESRSPLETQESKGRGKSFAANSTTVKNSGTVAPLQSVRVPKRTEQQPVKFTVNDAGWLQMPKAKTYGFVRWLTVRRLNYQMACAFSNIKLATDEQGRNIVQGNQIAFRWGDRLIFEDDLLGDDGELGFAHLRNQVFENNMLTQSAFNDLLERLFMDSLGWHRANGEDGSKRLKAASPAFVFFNDDSKLFQAARQKR